MRDILILVLLVGAGLWTLRQPWVGIITWTVVSLGSPHMTFGYAAAGWPVATGIAACTLLGLLYTKEKQNPLLGAPVWWLLAFTVWISVVLPFSFNYEPSEMLWIRSMKIFLMTFVALAMLTDRKKLEVFIWANALSIAYYGVKGGVFTIATGGNYRVWGPGGFIEGNNEIALAVITVIPLLRYLQTRVASKVGKLAFTGAIALCAIMALGTYSRGALLGLASMAAFFWAKGRNKLSWGVLLVSMGLVALSLMPEEWWRRMDTIQTYQSDGSAMGRINAWWAAYNVAMANFFGGGFMIWTPDVFARYAPVADDVHAAHSIYFQVLGEQGFVGLFLFLGIGASTWLTVRKLTRLGRLHTELQWAADLGQMIFVSMVAYGVTGAFLSLAYFDLPYNVMVMAVVGLHVARWEAKALAVSTNAMPTSIQQQPLKPQLRTRSSPSPQ